MTEEKKKERVIHTRISESLDDQIKRKATRLGISVSNLVRNVLLNTFGLVEDIVADSAHIAKSARGRDGSQESRKPRPHTAHDDHDADERGRILGWQEVMLNLNAVCDSCNSMLTKGTHAGIAVTEHPGTKVIVCKSCLDKSIAQEEGHARH